jgi:hypothetical protein
MTSTTPPTPNPLPQPTAPPVRIFEEWAQSVSQVLDANSSHVGNFIKHGTLIGDAREAMIHEVLEQVLPSIYEIGTGQVIDAAGNCSKQMDIIIARKDFPVLRFAGGSAQYLVESVLATIEVKSKLHKKGLIEALDNCYSIGGLSPSYKGAENFTAKLREQDPSMDFHIQPNGVLEQKELPDGPWIRAIVPVQQIWRKSLFPETFIFSFDGYRSEGGFSGAIAEWFKSVENDPNRGIPSIMHLPTVTATQNQVCVLNRDPNLLNHADRTWPILLLAPEPNPLGCLLFHLLLKLHRVTLAPNTDGLTPTMEKYLVSRTTTGPAIVTMNY